MVPTTGSRPSRKVGDDARRGDEMRKTTKLPREQLNRDDGLGAGPTDQDVEGHLHDRLPGTAGDLHRPAGGGEVRMPGTAGDALDPDDKDVEGHLFHQLPGTGGDISHRPSGGGE
jgi:hypothetical protein